MLRESLDQWQIPREVAGVLHFEDFGSLRGRMGMGESHRHAELEVHVVLRGHGVVLLGEERVLIQPGTVIWVPPEVDHILLEGSDDMRRWMLLVRPSAVRRILPGSEAKALFASRTSAELVRTLPKTHVRSLAGVFAEARDQAFVSTPIQNASIEFALARSWVLFGRAATTPETSSLNPAIARAVRLLREPEPPALGRLAKQCGLSRSWLSRLFAEQVGVSITDFRNRQRVDRFVELFGDGTDRTMTDAALDAGFGSYAQFYRVFREVTGRTPAEHRRLCRGE